MKKAFHFCNHGTQCPLLQQFWRYYDRNIRVWDNDGQTFDRYTVAIKRGPTDWEIYGMSSNPNSPQGFNQFSHMHNGTCYLMDKPNKRVRPNRIPFEVVKAISERM